MGTAAAGLGALGFWIFIAAIVVAGIWYDAKKRESQQETLRRIVESGREIDSGTIDRVLNNREDKSLERDLKVSALITIAVSPGLAILGIFIAQIDDKALYPLLGVSLLVACVGTGLFLAAKLVERRYPDNQG